MKKTMPLMSVLVTTLAAMFVWIGGTNTASAQGKIGWVDLDRVLSEFNEFKEAEDLFRKDAASWEAEYDSLQGDYYNKLDDYQKKQLVLTEERRKQIEADLKTMQQTLSEAEGRLKGQAEKRRAELVNPILQKIHDVVNKIATDEDYDYVLNASQIYMTANGLQFAPIMYAKKKLDITDRVFEELAKLK